MQKLQRWNTQEKALTDAEVDLEREKRQDDPTDQEQCAPALREKLYFL